MREGVLRCGKRKGEVEIMIENIERTEAVEEGK